MDPVLAWLVRCAAALAFILAAAKAHGRQVRLEREAAGVFSVDFRRPNPPAVEAIWRQDRRGFWTVFWVLAGVNLVNGTLAVILFQLAWGIVVLMLAWAFGVAFVVAGIGSGVRRTRRRATGRVAQPQGVRRATVLWWMLVAAGATLALLSLAA